MMRYLLDVNVLLDLFLNRMPWANSAATIWDAHVNKQIEALVAAFTLPTIFYVARRQSNHSIAQSCVNRCISTLAIAPVDQRTLLMAQGYGGSDFEDDLQIACAVQARVDGIVTRNPSDFIASPIPVIEPAVLVSQLSATGTP